MEIVFAPNIERVMDANLMEQCWDRYCERVGLGAEDHDTPTAEGFQGYLEYLGSVVERIRNKKVDR